MLSLAALRYRNVLADLGGPVAAIEVGPFPVRGQLMTLANATLKPGLSKRTPTTLYSNADGSGLHRSPVIARHMAVSEALERWAFSALAASERAADYGFDIDPSTCGMSAFPGLFGRQARRRSVLEGIERYCIMCWWDGLLSGRSYDTDWPGVSAVAIDGPFGGVTAVVYARTSWGGYAYGHAADESFTAASQRAVYELARHEGILRAWWLSSVAGAAVRPAHLFERRCLHFASADGHRAFLARVNAPPRRAAPPAEIICDCELHGPWSDYATVWRFALRPPSDGYLRGGDDYFFL